MRTTRRVQNLVTVIAMVCLATLAAPAAESEKSAIKVPPELEKLMQMPEGKEREKALQAATLEWVKQDPIAALIWAHQLPASLNSTHLYVIARCGEKHGKICADWLLQNKPKSYGSLHFVMHYWANTDPAPAMEWCMQAPEEVRHLSFCSMGDGWTYADPAGAIAAFSKVKALEDRRSMAYGICKAWTWTRTEEAPAATAWAMGLEPKEVKLSAFYGIGVGWSRYYLPATTAWTKSLKDHEEMRVAAYGVAKMIQKGLTEKQQGAERVKDVGHYDRSFAKEWLDQFPLSDAEKTAILNGPEISMKDPGKVVWPQ